MFEHLKYYSSFIFNLLQSDIFLPEYTYILCTLRQQKRYMQKLFALSLQRKLVTRYFVNDKDKALSDCVNAFRVTLKQYRYDFSTKVNMNI